MTSAAVVVFVLVLVVVVASPSYDDRCCGAHYYHCGSAALDSAMPIAAAADVRDDAHPLVCDWKSFVVRHRHCDSDSSVSR